MPMHEADTVAKLEDALVKVIKAEHVERKIKKAFKGYQDGSSAGQFTQIAF